MLKVKVNEGGFAPTKAHEGDAGWDLRTPVEFTLKGGEIGKVNTLLQIQGEVGKYYRVDEKSGLAAQGIHVIGGIVDRNYTGYVHVVLQNMKPESIKFEKGSKIAQMLVCPVEDDSDLFIIKELNETSRGDGGFGSTGNV